jgi:hypothetical protein
LERSSELFDHHFPAQRLGVEAPDLVKTLTVSVEKNLREKGCSGVQRDGREKFRSAMTRKHVHPEKMLERQRTTLQW